MRTTDVRLFGLVLRVPTELGPLLPAPGLAGSARTPDVEVTLRGAPVASADSADGTAHFATCHCYSESDRLCVRHRADGGFAFWFGDGTWAGVSADSSRIGLHTPAGSTLADSVTYLTGPVLGFVLRLRGVLALHASAVVLDGGAIAFAGQSGSGKSTAAAMLALQGVPVLSEDLVALTPITPGSVLRAHSGYPSVRLWPSAAAMLATASLPTVTPRWGKLALDVPAPPHSAPLRAVYLLGERVQVEGPAEVIDISLASALLELVSSTYVPHLLRAEDRATEFRQLEALVQRVPVRRLRMSRPSRGGELVALLRRDLAR